MRPVAGIVIGIVAIVVGAILLVDNFTGVGEETTASTFQEVSELVFDLENSAVTIVGGGDAETIVEIEVTTGLIGGDVTHEQRGGALHLEQRCPLIIGWGCRAFVVVSLPAGVEVSGSTSNGAITAESIDEPISVTTSNGPINVVDISASATLRSSNGDIFALETSSPEVDASTSNGRVQLEFSEAPGSVRATSSNGAIMVILPNEAPAYAVNADTSNGDVVTEVRTDPAATDTIEAETSNGDITVRYRG